MLIAESHILARHVVILFRDPCFKTGRQHRHRPGTPDALSNLKMKCWTRMKWFHSHSGCSVIRLIEKIQPHYINLVPGLACDTTNKWLLGQRAELSLSVDWPNYFPFNVLQIMSKSLCGSIHSSRVWEHPAVQYRQSANFCFSLVRVSFFFPR